MTATKATPKFFRAVKGISDGYAHYINGMVFESSPALDLHFERTGGIGPDGSVLYVEADETDYSEFAAAQAADEQAREDASRGSVDAKRLTMSSPINGDNLAGPGTK